MTKQLVRSRAPADSRPSPPNDSRPADPVQGLSEAEAKARRARGQGNKLPPATTRTYGQILRENVLSFINIAIFVLGAALVMVGRPMDALLSVGIIFLNISVSVVQEVRAKKILDHVALLTRPTATVVREGKPRQAQPDELVLGDVLKVTAGDQILLDGRVLDGQMAVDESQLTGESDLVRKKVGDPVYSGSFCVTGSAAYVVEKVGSDSLANQMTASARAYRRVMTPLQKQIGMAVRLILFMVIYLQLLLIGNNLLNAVPLPRGVAQATVLVSLVPNGLFLSIAIAYALGAVRIVRYGALLQQSNAIESLSNVDVLCLDKTGTLTTNNLSVDQVVPLDGSGDKLKAVIGTMIASAKTRNRTSDAIAKACSGDPQDPLCDVPFSSQRKWSAVAFDSKGASGLHGIYALGAPEMLHPYLTLPVGSQSGEFDPGDDVARRIDSFTARGLRVLLVAHHPDPTLLENKDDDSTLPHGMTPLGLISLSDELRDEAKEVLGGFVASGVRPKIISGDSPETVAALARQAGFNPNAKLISGLDLEKMDDQEFDHAALEGDIFGRIAPQQKERLVSSLRRHGHYVAMIGDGVNDVLSLKKADLGIAMQSGSQATRGVADIVLVNDSFAALQPAVMEGQRIVNGMQDILKLFLTRIATMMLVILSAWTIGLFPIAVRQGTIVTLWTVGIPTVLLAIWARPGYRAHQTLMRTLIHFVLPPALISSVLGLVVFYLPFATQLTPAARALTAEQFLETFGPVIRTNQTALSAFLIGVGLLLLIFVEPPTEWWEGGDVISGDWRPTLLACGLGVAFVLVMFSPHLREFFDLAPLPLMHVLLVIAALLLWLVLVRSAWRRKWLAKALGI